MPSLREACAWIAVMTGPKNQSAAASPDAGRIGTLVAHEAYAGRSAIREGL